MTGLLVSLCALSFSGVSAAATIGEPAARVAPRMIHLDSEFEYAMRDIDLGSGCCVASDSFRLLLKISGLLFNRIELFARLGGVVMQEIDRPGLPDFDGSPGFSIGGGLKITLYEAGPIVWGAGTQVLFYESDDDRTNVGVVWHEVDFFTGPTLEIANGVTVYGGLLATLIFGEISGPGGTFDLEEQRPLGFFLGGQVDVTRGLFIGMETRLINELSFSSRVGVDF